MQAHHKSSFEDFRRAPQAIDAIQISGTSIDALRSDLDEYLASLMGDDAAHDISHLRRVVSAALAMGQVEGANPLVVMAAAYFHDIVNLPKSHPERHLASRHSAARAEEILRRHFPQFPLHLYGAVAHAIEAHSFSAGVPPETIEAKVVQDADRLEALGAIGIARVFYIAGKLGQSLFDGEDPVAVRRELDDKAFAVDHFRAKLLKLHETMQTQAGREYALENSRYLMRFLAKLSSECKGEMLGLDEDMLALLQDGGPHE